MSLDSLFEFEAQLNGTHASPELLLIREANTAKIAIV